MSIFDNQIISIDCIGKLGHLFGLLGHYLLRSVQVELADFKTIIFQKSYYLYMVF